MFDQYCDKQVLAYNILKGEIESNRISHAYLFDENNYSEAFNMVISFVCELLCKNLSDIEKEIIIKRIHENNYPELKIIEPDGMFIKKKQILDLQQDFSMSAIEGKWRIYIIRDADRMRSETANSMLKFLEEPGSNIIAILMTNNFNNMLSTIISRCQVIKFGNENKDCVDNKYLELALEIVKKIEYNGIKAVTSVSDILFNNISSKDREKMVLIFDNMVDIYYDIIKVEIGKRNIKYKEYYDVFFDISSKNNHEVLLEKINYLVMAKDSIKYNVNSNLLVDSVVVNLGGKYEGSWS